MSAGSEGAASSERGLPPRPNIEHLRNEAKARLRALRSARPEAHLAEAQLEVARRYGFRSWRALKAAVEADRTLCAAADDRFVGCYRIDPSQVTNAVIAVAREGARLWMQRTGRPRMRLVPDGAGGFSTPGLEQRYRFEITPQGPARALLIEMPAGTVRAERTDAADAGAARAGYDRDLAEQARPRTRITLPPEALDRCVGAYAAPSGLVMTIRRRGGSLFAEAAGQSELEILPEADGRFFFAAVPAQLEFHGGTAPAEALILHQHGHGTSFRRVTEAEARRIGAEVERRRTEQERPRTAVPIRPETLEKYPGRYRMSSSFELLVTCEEGRLFGQATGQRRFEMFPETESEFFATVAAVQFGFLAGEDGQVDSVVVHQHGRDLLMVRVEQEGNGK